MAKWFLNLLSLIITLGVPVILILSNVLLFMNPAWLALQYSQPDFPKAERFNDQARLYYGSESIEYIRGNRTLEQFSALGVYQDREIQHMIDVRALVDKVKIILPVTFILVVLALALLSFPALLGKANAALAPASTLEGRGRAARALRNGGILTIGLFLVFGIFAAVGFNTFFTLFHRILFTGDSWLFLYTDSLIQFYPLPFWFATSITLIVLTVVEAAVVGAMGWGWGWGRKVVSG